MMNFRTCLKLFSRALSVLVGQAESGEPSVNAFEQFLSSNLVRGGLLFSTISVASYGGGALTGDAIQAAINAAQTGDTVSIPAGSYSVTTTITVNSQGITITGAPNDTTILNFNLPSPSYGIELLGGDSNVTIESLNMISNYGVIGMYDQGAYTNIVITNNALKFGGGSTSNGTDIFGIYGTVTNHYLQITSNYFHDSPSSVRDWEIWDADNTHLDYNTLYNVVDGGHTCEPQANVSFSHNYGSHIHRMGQEIQGSTVGTNLVVDYNCFFDWVSPYYDSFGLSIVNHFSTGSDVSYNYLDANIATGSSWGIADSGGNNRFGYAIEAGGLQMTVNNNTIVGDWIAGIVASRLNISASNNSKYGPANWGDWIGEPSVDGYGSLILTNDSVDRAVADAPATPTIPGTGSTYLNAYQYNPSLEGTPPSQTATFTGTTVAGTSSDSSSGTGLSGTSSGTSTGTTSTSSGRRPVVTGAGSSSSTLGDTGVTTSGDTVEGTPIEIDPAQNIEPVVGSLGTLTVTVLSSTSAKISWSQNPPQIGKNNNVISVSQFEVDVESTKGKQHFPSVVYSDDLTSATVINLHPGWQIDFTVSAFMSDGTAYRSGPYTTMFSGDSTAPFVGSLWGGISTAATPQ